MAAPPRNWLPILESAYGRYHATFRRDRDPIALVHRYARREDREVAALVAALLAYGNVKTIQASVANVLAPLGDRPSERLRDGVSADLWSGFRHRFTTGGDIAVLLCSVREALLAHGSLEGFFRAKGTGATAKDRLVAFVDAFHAIPLAEEQEQHRQQRMRSLRYLLSSPADGSACKRLNLFLRWVVRPDDGIDLGLWTTLRPADLYLPVDTHLLKILQQLRWTRRKNATWLLTEEATAKLRTLDAVDPIRFDFSLCHLSMAGDDVLRLHEAPCAVGTTTRLQRKPAARTTRRGRSTSSKK